MSKRHQRYMKSYYLANVKHSREVAVLLKQLQSQAFLH